MLTAGPAFGRWAGLALIGGGLGLLAIAGLSTMLPLDDSIRGEPLFVWRQVVAIVTALLLLLGAIGLYARLPRRCPFAAIAFVLAVTGCTLLVGHEWQELFLARDLAANYPDMFARIENAPGLSPFDLGALIAVTAFTLGWLAMAAAALLGGDSRLGAWLVIGGMFAIPLLTAAAGAPLGPLLGSAVLAAGFVLLGVRLRAAAD